MHHQAQTKVQTFFTFTKDLSAHYRFNFLYRIDNPGNDRQHLHECKSKKVQTKGLKKDFGNDIAYSVLPVIANISFYGSQIDLIKGSIVEHPMSIF